MYLEHFGLSVPPFRITPDNRFFFPGANRGTTLEALVYAITHDEGFVTVSGAAGSGKTALCRMLIERLSAQVVVVHLAYPMLSPEDVRRAVIGGLGLAVPDNAASDAVQAALLGQLEALQGAGRRAVVLIDEAHTVPAETLDEVKRLSDLASNRRKLLPLVLFGQPELNDILARPDMRQLRERITHNFALAPLMPEEISQFLDFRLRAAGYRGAEVFCAAAVALMAATSLGLPRRVNVLADKALLAAADAGRRQVTKKDVRTAIGNSEFAATARKFQQRKELRVAAGAALGVLALALGWRAAHEAAAPAATTATLRQISVAASPEADGVPSGAPPPAAAPSPHATAAAPANWPELAPATSRLIAASRDWLLTAPGDHWFVQLARQEVAAAATVEAVALDASRLLDPAQLRAYAIEREGVRRVGLIYGEFASYADAAVAIDAMPAAIKALLPYPRQIHRLR
ncbi:MAG: AAA family ATPase [Rhodocyclales bacterium]|nr:AAA family ATPase [Rhodocyclales bacterium]